jgi:hypothetical protein
MLIAALVRTAAELVNNGADVATVQRELHRAARAMLEA